MSVAADATTPESQASQGAAPVRLLLVEDNPADVFFLIDALDGRYPGGTQPPRPRRWKKPRACSPSTNIDVALLDLTLPDSRGLGTIEKLAQFAPELPIVVLTGIDDERIAPDVVRCGAQDYLLKGQSDSATIARAIQYAIDRKRIEAELRAQRRELEEKNRELQEAQNRLEMYRDRYVDLYDFAPLGYVDPRRGRLRAGDQPGRRRHAGRGSRRDHRLPFSNYVLKEDVPVLLDMVRQCVGEHRDATCELRLMAHGGRVDYGPTPQRSHQGRRRGDGRRDSYFLQDGHHRHHRSQADGGGDSPVPRLPANGDRRDAGGDVGHLPRLSRRAGQSLARDARAEGPTSASSCLPLLPGHPARRRGGGGKMRSVSHAAGHRCAKPR